MIDSLMGFLILLFVFACFSPFFNDKQKADKRITNTSSRKFANDSVVLIVNGRTVPLIYNEYADQSGSVHIDWICNISTPDSSLKLAIRINGEIIDISLSDIHLEPHSEVCYDDGFSRITVNYYR